MEPATPSYVRRERTGPLSFSTRLYQGIGAIPDTIKNWVFNTFLLLFYNQVLGVDAFLVSVALAVAITFDAVSDPLVATLSDNLRTRWGRRHPLMLVASLPLGAALCAVFFPPSGLSQTGLFLWLLTFTLLTRGLMTLFFVPWAAIAAELSDDYHERTSVMSYRFAVGWTVGVGFPLLVYTVVMPSTPEFPVGQLNPAGYPLMAILAGCLLSGGALATTLLTWREIPYLRHHAGAATGFGIGRTLSELRQALRNRQFALIFVIVLLASAIGGTTANLNIYMATYFWGLTTADLRWFALAAIGALIAFPLVAAIQRRWDKKHILMVCSVLNLADGLTLVNLRFLEALPANGDRRLLFILVGAAGFSALISVIQGIIGASIVADLLDDHELRTGYRQEGMFNAALSFSAKAMTGGGTILGGLILTLIAFPTGAEVASVEPTTIHRLGLIVGVAVPLLYLIPITLISRYRITRRRHDEIRAALEQRRRQPMNEGNPAA